MDVTEHPAVIATNALIGQYGEAVADGKMQTQLAYAFLAADILGAAVEVHRRRDTSPEVERYLIELASEFAIARRHDALVSIHQVPDDISGLDDIDDDD